MYLLGADGGEAASITPLGTAEGQPAFSPDGKKLVFLSDRGGPYDLWTMNVDGTDPRQLTHSPGIEFEPAWSPDGRYITYDIDRDVYIVNSDGSNEHVLTATHLGGGPHFLGTRCEPDRVRDEPR